VELQNKENHVLALQAQERRREVTEDDSKDRLAMQEQVKKTKTKDPEKNRRSLRMIAKIERSPCFILTLRIHR
jgi:hypothetical protein